MGKLSCSTTLCCVDPKHEEHVSNSLQYCRRGSNSSADSKQNPVIYVCWFYTNTFSLSGLSLGDGEAGFCPPVLEKSFDSQSRQPSFCSSTEWGYFWLFSGEEI